MARGGALAQNADLDAAHQRLREFDSYTQPIDATAAEVARLRTEVAALSARFAQHEVRLERLPPTSQVELGPESYPDRAVGGDNRLFGLPPEESGARTTTPEVSREDFGDGYGSGRDFQLTFWGWLSYIAAPQEKYYTFWAWEAELDITKSFTDRLAAAADLDMIDTNSGARPNIEQLFVSIMFPRFDDAILTTGKFNAPYGIEPRDFWNRLTGSTSLLFFAQPQDLVGLMYTQPCECTDLIFRPFVVNGINNIKQFRNNLDSNQQPSVGMMVEYRPSDRFSLATTNWWGPEFPDNNGDKLYFTEAQATWQVWPKLFLLGEFLYGTTQSPSGRLNWTGYALIASRNLNERWRLFAQYSDLNDENGFITGYAQHQQQGSAGIAYYLTGHVEARFEYRHDNNRSLIGPGVLPRDVDEISAHLTFGF